MSHTSHESRVTALDGLRGLLALLVVIAHVFRFSGNDLLRWPAALAVIGFFMLSGYVLTRAWHGRFVLFLVRRFIRLWPLYAVCLATGYLLAWRSPTWTEFLWYPFWGAGDPRNVDPPTWSLVIEAWAMPLMPAIIWASRGHVMRTATVMIALLVVGLQWRLGWLPLPFIAGAYFARLDFRNQWLETTIPQWLGKVSYSLYLTHVLVMLLFMQLLGHWGLGHWGPLMAIPVIFPAAWAAWFFIENPSIWLSRRVWSLTAPPRTRTAAASRGPKSASVLTSQERAELKAHRSA